MTTEKPMQLGMIGLGRMGANLVRRLMRDGHRCVVYNRSPGRIEELQGEGAEGAFTLQELVARLEDRGVGLDHGPGAAAVVSVDQLSSLLEPGDIVIDGGNSYRETDNIMRARRLAEHGLKYVDVGTSGGLRLSGGSAS